MVIFETSAFTRAIRSLIDDDAYANLQDALAVNPELGDVIQGTNGLRKVRWAIPGGGKRGGMRVIYYWIMPRDQIYMLLAYAKNRQDDLNPEQRRALVRLVKQELEDG
jgi:hypothetical protein